MTIKQPCKHSHEYPSTTATNILAIAGDKPRLNVLRLMWQHGQASKFYRESVESKNILYLKKPYIF